MRLRTWLLVFGARVRFLSQSSTAIGLTALIGVSAQRGLTWFLMYDWYAALVEYRSGISSCSYRAITAPKLAAPAALGCSGLSRNRIACTTGDFLAADSVEYSSRRDAPAWTDVLLESPLGATAVGIGSYGASKRMSRFTRTV